MTYKPVVSMQGDGVTGCTGGATTTVSGVAAGGGRLVIGVGEAGRDGWTTGGLSALCTGTAATAVGMTVGGRLAVGAGPDRLPPPLDSCGVAVGALGVAIATARVAVAVAAGGEVGTVVAVAVAVLVAIAVAVDVVIEVGVEVAGYGVRVGKSVGVAGTGVYVGFDVGLGVGVGQSDSACGVPQCVHA